MSSFICSAKHFNSIEKAITEYNNLENGYAFHFNGDYATTESLITMLNNLRFLNVVCVTFQYRHIEPIVDAEIQSELKEIGKPTQIKPLTLLGLFNALSCVDYQIETEHVSGLYDEIVNATMPTLKAFISCLAEKIVRNLPEDKTCTWSID